MKKILISLALAICGSVSFAQDNLSALVPMPNKIENRESDKPFRIENKLVIYTNVNKDAFCVQELERVVESRLGRKVDVSYVEDPDKADVLIILDDVMGKGERYVLDVNCKQIDIKGESLAALQYAVATLDQLLLGDVSNTKQGKIAAVIIDDAPRYSYRSLMLDPARHFLPAKDVKFYIDQMAKYKYNVLQMHLTDDQGWTIEIKQHPELTANNQFYTQEEMKDLINYAAERNIRIVPELDIPGHTVAVLVAHPELGCTHTDTISKVLGQTTNMMLCASNEDVYSLYADVIKEVARLFPYEYIHLGGDESIIEKNWSICDKCRATMDSLGYDKAAQLMEYFFGRILPMVRENGKKPILWCELDNIYPPATEYLFDYPKDVTLITWRNRLTPTCLELSHKHGNNLIMSPGEYAYFDYPQYANDFPEFDNWGMPITTLQKVYEFDPGYGLPADQQSHIVGVNATLWGEAIKNINRALYMTYPRGLAFAEAGWTNMDSRDWHSFKNRIYPNITDMMKRGVSVRVPFEIAEK